MARTLVHLETLGELEMPTRKEHWEDRTESAYNTGVVITSGGRTIACSPNLSHIKSDQLGLAARVIRKEGLEMTPAQREVAEEQAAALYLRIRREVGLSNPGFQPGTIVTVRGKDLTGEDETGIVVEDNGRILRIRMLDKVELSLVHAAIPMGPFVIQEHCFRDDEDTTGIKGLLKAEIDRLLDPAAFEPALDLLGGDKESLTELVVGLAAKMLEKKEVRPGGSRCMVTPSSEKKQKKYLEPLIELVKDDNDSLLLLVENTALGYDVRGLALAWIKDPAILKSVLNEMFTWNGDEEREYAFDSAFYILYREQGHPLELLELFAQSSKIDALRQICYSVDILEIDSENQVAWRVIREVFKRKDPPVYSIGECWVEVMNYADDKPSLQPRLYEMVLEVVPKELRSEAKKEMDEAIESQSRS